MSERFFLSSPALGTAATLVGEEARHLVRVLRAKVGDAIHVFDGSGRAWPAVVSAIARDRVDLELGEPVADPPRTSPPLSLAVALPKGDRQKWMVEKLVELGAARLVPLATARGVAEATPSAVERLSRCGVEACKQCGRNTLLEIARPHSLSELIAAKPADSIGILADPRGGLLTDALPAGRDGPRKEVLALVGPEGGFTDEERATARRADFLPVRIGPHVLRVETAAVAIAAAVAACGSDGNASGKGEKRLEKTG